jgi:hypothetical protein
MVRFVNTTAPGLPAIQAFLARVVDRVIGRRGDRTWWTPYAVQAAGQLRRQFPFSMLWSTSPPVNTHLTARRLKRRYGTPWIADFRDPLAENPFASAHLLRQAYTDRMQDGIFAEADWLVANTEAVAELWRQKYPRYRDKICVIYNGFDPAETFGPAPIPNRPYRTILHAGDIYGHRHPGVLMDSLLRLAKAGRVKPDRVRLQLIGPDEALLVSHSPSFAELTRLGCLDYQPGLVSREEALAHTATADFLLLLDLTGGELNLQLPAKLFDYVRAGRPVLAFTAEASPAQQILGHSGLLYKCIYPGDSNAAVDDKVFGFLQLPSEARTPSEWFHRRFNALAQTAALVSILKQIDDVRYNNPRSRTLT